MLICCLIHSGFFGHAFLISFPESLETAPAAADDSSRKKFLFCSRTGETDEKKFVLELTDKGRCESLPKNASMSVGSQLIKLIESRTMERRTNKFLRSFGESSPNNSHEVWESSVESRSGNCSSSRRPLIRYLLPSHWKTSEHSSKQSSSDHQTDLISS